MPAEMRGVFRGGSTSETNPLPGTPMWCVRAPRLSLPKRRNPYGSRKTRHKAPCEAQKVFKAHKRLFSNQEQAVPVGAGSGESRGSIRVSRPAREETAVPAAVDSACWCGGPVERADVRPADSRIEGGGCDAGSQSSGGHRGEGCGGVCGAGGNGAGGGASGEEGEG